MFDLGSPKDSGFDEDRLARIPAFLQESYIASDRLPNTQLIVARGGVPVHYSRLGSMGEDGRELRDDAIFRIASMTKPVTSIAFMQLVEQCKVALEEPISKVIPEFADFLRTRCHDFDLPFSGLGRW